MDKEKDYIIYIPFKLVPFNTYFRHQMRWCKRYPHEYKDKRWNTGIIVCHEKTFDTEYVSSIIDTDTVVGMLRQFEWQKL